MSQENKVMEFMKLRSVHKISINYYRKHIVQSILLVLGIALGVSVVVAIDIANKNAGESFRSSMKKLNGEVSHSIYGVSDKINEKVYFDIRRHLGYENVSPVIERDVRLKGSTDSYYTVVGLDPFSDPEITGFFSSKGVRLNSNSLQYLLTVKNTAIVSPDFDHDNPVKPGDTIKAEYDDRTIKLKVVDVFQTSGGEQELLLNDKIFVDISTAQEIFDYKGFISRIDINIEEGQYGNESELNEYLARNYPEVHLVKNRSLERENKILTRAFELNLKALSLITILVAFFLIYNTFNYSLVVRRPVFAVMRSIGVTSGDIFRLMLTEALVIGFTGCLAGILFGLFLGNFSVDLVKNTYRSIYNINTGTLTDIPLHSVIKSMFIGMDSVILAVVVPSLESRLIQPVNIARSSLIQSVVNKITPIMLTCGAIMVITGLYINLNTELSIEANFIALFILIVGYSLCLPFMMRITGELIFIFQRGFLSRINLIACKNYLQSIGTNFTATASLVIAVSVFLSMTVLIDSFRTTLTKWLDDNFKSDVFISSVEKRDAPADFDHNTLRKIYSVKGISDIGFSRKIEIITETYGSLNLLALSDNPPIHPQIIDNFDEKVNSISGLGTGEVLISESLYSKHKDKIKNKIISLPTATGEKSYKIVGVFSDFATQKGTIILNYNTFRRHWDDHYLTSISFNYQGGLDHDVIMKDIRSKLSDVSDYRITTSDGLKKAAHKIFDETFVITRATRLIAFIVAFLGILGALLCLELSKNRQIGILRSIGATIGDIKKIILLETGIIGLISGVLSIPLGFVMSYLLVRVINYKSFGWTIDFLLKPEHLAEAVALSVVAAILAGIYPAHVFSDLKISELLKNE